MSTFCGFVARVLCEAKKRKISIRGEDLLLQLLAAVGEVTAEAGEQLAATSKEGDFSILAVTRRSGRRARYSERPLQWATRSLQRIEENPTKFV